MRSVISWMTTFGLLLSVVQASAQDSAPARPNVLWISTEDISPDLGCYEDKYAVTPTIDRLAAEGVRFTRCFTHAGVCAPSRSGVITGMYPCSIGTHNMRCKGIPPINVKCFPEYLRAHGYYCTNNVKTDYQFDLPISTWDESSNKADWRGRAKGQPFFSVINITTTHESQIRSPGPATKKLVASLKPEQRHDPEKCTVPPFYPDTPVVRKDIANYYDNITAMDGEVAAILKRLEDDGLLEETIIFFWGDHGRGMPRYKRWLYSTGTHVPLIVRVPEKWRGHVRPDDQDAVKPGSVNGDLTAFVDLAPTMLSLASIPIPSHLQGQAFFGPQRAAEPRQYVYGHRDRMDETYDLIRTVRDKRFRYVRNFMPWQPYAQEIAYMDEMPTMQEWRRLHAEDKLTGPQAAWFQKKPTEELYDTETDPFELNNLVQDKRYSATLDRMRAQLTQWMSQIHDVGLIPESILDEMQRPVGKWAKTAPPGVRRTGNGPNGKRDALMISCGTPGASVVYRVGKKGAAPAEMSPWMVPQAQPNDDPLLLEAPAIAVLDTGEVLEAKAIRIGFKESDVTRYESGQRDIPDTSLPAPPHWSLKLPDTRRLTSVIGASDSGNRGEGGGVNDRDPAVQYWSMFSLLASGKGAKDEKIASALRDVIFRDAAPVAKITAAARLMEVEDPAPHLKLIAEYLDHAQPSVQLCAITTLAELGDKAKPLIEEIRKATKGSEYVSRVAQRALKNLGEKGE